MKTTEINREMAENIQPKRHGLTASRSEPEADGSRKPITASPSETEAGAITLEGIEQRIIDLRGEKVLLDCEVAALYGVETKHINQAVRNNPDKFPKGYFFELAQNETIELVKIFDQFNLKHSSTMPKAFTEKGLYMLATILKSERATQTTIAIIEAFAKIRELSRTLAQLAETPDEPTQKSLMRKSGEIMADIFGKALQKSETATEIELNFAVLKLKHTITCRKE